MAVASESSEVEIVCPMHFSQLTSALKELATSGVLTDITFICEDGTLQAHQVVLSAFSASLRQISVGGGRKSCVFVTNANKLIVQALLQYLYEGYACINKHELDALTEAAGTLKVDCFSQTQLEYVGDKVYVRFPGHECLLRENLQRLRSSQTLCDVVFVTEDFSRVYSHSCIMATCSRMLQSVLMNQRRSNDGPCVLVLEGVKLEHFTPILDFCYRGSSSMSHELVCKTHAVARFLEIDYVREILVAIDPPLSATTDASDQKKPVSANTVRLMDMMTEPGNGRDSFRNFQRILSHLASAESLTDVTLLKDGRYLRAHSVLLCAFGPYFKELEEKLGHELKEAVVLVKSLSGSLLQSYLDYLYRGEAQFSGSPREFCSLMSNWIDFSLLPADDSSTFLPCDGISAEKTCEVLGLSLDNISCVVELSEEFDLGRDAVLIQGDSETVELVTQEDNRREAAGNECKKSDNMTQWVELTALKVEEVDGKLSAKLPSKVNPKVCRLCKEEFTSIVEFRRHFANHPESKWVTCTHCSKTFATTGELRVHMRSHTELRPFQCNVCNKSFAARSVLRKHRVIHESDPSKAYRCSVCSKSFLRREYFQEHLRTHSGTKPFKCPTCGKGFVGRTGLNHHIKTHTSTDERRNCVCEVCGKYFTRHALWTHIKTHKKVHMCETCGKACATPAALKVHVQGMHLGEREHTCHVCAKSFGERRHLLRHIRSHDQDKDYRYICTFCSRIFKTEDQLKKHSLLHHKAPGDLPFSCDICDKSFAGRSTLIYHRRSHTGERPYTCLVCDKSFSRPDAFKKHECIRRDEILLYECSLCEKIFYDVEARNEHVKSHKDNVYRCDVCRKSFRHQGSLARHTKTHMTERDGEVPTLSDHDYTAEAAANFSNHENEILQHAPVSSEHLVDDKKKRHPLTVTIGGNLTDSLLNKHLDSRNMVVAESAGTSTQDTTPRLYVTSSSSQ